MTSRALCGVAYAHRSGPSLGSAPGLSASLSCGDLAMVRVSANTRQVSSAWQRCLHSLRTTSSGRSSMTSHGSRHCLKHREQMCSGLGLSLARSPRRALRLVSGCTRPFSHTAGSLAEDDEARKRGQAPSQKQQQQPQPQSRSAAASKPPATPEATAAEPRGIRKVIPALTQHENIYTVPNILTFSRLAAAPFIGYAILHDAHSWALGLFAYAGFSDLLDGWIARRWKLQTVVGSVVDPMADKILMTVLTVSLAYRGALPAWLAVIILGRDVGLGIAAIYYRWISLPPPKTFSRYWDFSLPSAEVRPTTISKYNTFLQLGLMGATMVTPFVSADVGGVMTAFQYLVATTTVWSGLSYVFSKDAVKILSQNKDKIKDK